MTISDAISQAAETPAFQHPADQRVDSFAQNGTQFVDPVTQGMLATGNQSDQGVSAVASSIGQAITSTPQTLVSAARTVFEDPVLYKQPTAALRIHQWLTQQTGWLPVAQVDLRAVQQNLQAGGFGKNLDLSGVWTPEWQDAFHQAGNAHYKQAAASSEGGGFSIGHAFHSFVSALNPSHALPAIEGAVKAFPGQVRNIAADAIGAATQVGSDLYHTGSDLATGHAGGALDSALNVTKDLASPILFAFQGAHSHAAAQAGAFVENIGNHRTVTADDFNAEHGWRRALEDINTALVVFPMLKLGTSVADAGGQAIARGLTTDLGKQAVIRGPGTISNLLYRPAGYYPTAAGVDYVAGDSGLLAAKAFNHLPFLRQMMPAVRNAVEDGQRYWYYTARPFAAAPYRLPVVQALGHTLQNVTLTGALYRGDAAALGHIVGQNDFTSEVQAQHPYTGPVGMALDILGAVAHGPLNARLAYGAQTAEEAATQRPTSIPPIGIKPSEQVGNLVRGGHGAYDTALGKPGVIGAAERGIPGFKYDEALADFNKAGLDKSDLDWTLQSKVDQYAAGAAAHDELMNDASRGIVREDKFRDIAARIRGSDPASLGKARATLLDSDAALALRFAHDYNHIIQGSKAASGDMIAEAKARRVAYQLVNDPNLSFQNVHPGTFTALKDAAAERAFAATVEKATPTGPEPATTAGWLRTGNPEAPHASLGIARHDTKLRGQVLDLIKGFEDRATKIKSKADGLVEGRDPAAMDALKTEMAHLAIELHIDSNSIPWSFDSLSTVLKERADALAEKVAQPLNPTAEYTAARKALNDLGYELVSGTGIGFEFSNPIIDPVLVDGGIRTIRKAAESLGLGSTYAGTMDAAPWHQIAGIRSWQEAMNAGEVNPQPGWSPAALYRHAYDNRSLRLTGAKGAVFKLSENKNWRKMAVHASGPDATSEQVDARLAEWERQAAEQQSLLDMSGDEFVAAITARPTGGIPNPLTGELDPPVTEAEARLLQKKLIAAVAKRPKFIFGGAHLDDLIRAGGAGLAGRRTTNNRVLNRLAGAGNDYVRARNTYRFGIDPLFSFRRIAKSYLKLRTVGVPVSRHLPWEAMVQQGTLDEDLAYGNKLFPEVRGITEGMDANDRAIYHADLMGLFNPRHFIAYGAGWLKRMGMEDAQVKKTVEKALTYGDRTAMERTLGTIFYPLSFEKTLFRQVGARLLDEPGQRFMLAAAVQTYGALNQHYGINDWADKHFPVLQELNKLNAFSHGLGPGIPGGINRQFASATWNLLNAQHVTTESSRGRWFDAITAAVPAIQELNSLLVGYSPTSNTVRGGTLTSQASITYHAARNWVDDGTRTVFNNPRSPWNPQHPAETAAAQQDAGWSMRNHLILQWAAAIDYNYHHRTAPILFPTDGSVPKWLAGKTVDKSSIDDVVHHWFPAYDPAKPQQIAVEKQVEMGRYITQLQASNPDRGAAYAEFVDNAEKFNRYKGHAQLDPAQMTSLAQWTARFRDYAVSLAEQDPSFYKFYRTYWQTTFGPLEALTG